MADGQSHHRSRALARPLPVILRRSYSCTTTPTRRPTRHPMPRRRNTTDGPSSTEKRSNSRGQDLRERGPRVRPPGERDRLDQEGSKLPRSTRRTTESRLKKKVPQSSSLQPVQEPSSIVFTRDRMVWIAI